MKSQEHIVLTELVVNLHVPLCHEREITQTSTLPYCGEKNKNMSILKRDRNPSNWLMKAFIRISHLAELIDVCVVCPCYNQEWHFTWSKIVISYKSQYYLMGGKHTHIFILCITNDLKTAFSRIKPWKTIMDNIVSRSMGHSFK